MWRCNKLILFFICWPVFTWAQQKDFTPDYLDELVPDYTRWMFPESEFPYDSTYFTRTDSKRKLEINDSILFPGDTIIIKSYFLWNHNGKLISYRQYQKNLIHSQGKLKSKPAFELNVADTLIYRYGMLLTEIDRYVAMFGSLDTLKLKYNRIGKFDEQYLGDYFPIGKNKKDSVMKFFYDNEGRIKIIHNIKLRRDNVIYGTCFYGYNNAGKLCSRTITNPDGSGWLMSDTLIYDFVDSLKTQKRTRHYFKTNLNNNWTFVDERTENAITHATLSYKASRESFYQYNGDGKYKQIINRDTIGRQTVITDFKYGTPDAPDTMVNTSIWHTSGKQIATKNYQTTYIYHNKENGLIVRREAYEGLIEANKPQRKALRSVQYYKWE
jgi:hypothetical protein